MKGTLWAADSKFSESLITIWLNDPGFARAPVEKSIEEMQFKIIKVFALSLREFVSLSFHSYRFPLLLCPRLLAVQQEDEGRKTGWFSKRGGGGGLQGFCSVSWNLLTPLASALRLAARGGGRRGGQARREEQVGGNQTSQ